MAWFHPRTILDKTYEIGIIIKGVDGLLELIGGLFLLLVPSHAIDTFTRFVTESELAHDPHDFVATHVAHYGTMLAHNSHVFAVAFLLTHGITKIVIVACLLRNKLWAYPFALVVFSLFIIYQVVEMIHKATVGMGLLTVLDIFILWLIWREWQKVKHDRLPKAGEAIPQ